MQDTKHIGGWQAWRQGLGRLLFVIGGIVLGQAILYGPSLVGAKILLPLDILGQPRVYLPESGDSTRPAVHNPVRSDLILVLEPLRRFSAEEWAAGRCPRWTPYQYAGTPMPFGTCSPMWVLRCMAVSPLMIAWCQVFVSVLIGCGAYLFCRRVLDVSFWSAALIAWCYPMTGFFIFWEGFPLQWVAGWLPWSLLVIDAAVRRPAGWGVLGVAVVTGLIVADRQLDISGQVLLVSGLFALWRVGEKLFELRRGKAAEPISNATRKRAQRARAPWGRIWQQPACSAVAVACGWLLGFLLAAPCLLPTLEYARTGFRMRNRSSGSEERPPVGLAALPQAVLPDMYGSTQRGSFPLFPEGQGNQLESSAATYAGLLATLFAAPLAWCSRRHRSLLVFFAALAFLGISWCINVPGVVAFLRMPGLNMMSHNRLVFATSLAIMAMAAIGIDVLRDGATPRRWWFWLPLAVVAGLLIWCMYRSIVLPEPLATRLAAVVRDGRVVADIKSLVNVKTVQSTFVRTYLVSATLCGLALVCWLMVYFRAKLPKWFVPVLGGLMLADLLWFAYDRSVQSDPSLYYPPIPALQKVAQSTPGRILGCGCLPALLNHTDRLGDVRGDDGVEPARLIDLMFLAADPRVPKVPYALTQWMVPTIAVSRQGEIRLSPILDMFSVRYIVLRGLPLPGLRPDFSSPDYYAVINPRALPRVYVPEHVTTLTDDKERLKKLGAADFDPRAVAYVEQPVELPERCSGSADIIDEVPTRVSISFDMKTAGMLVLADLWDAGWCAYVDGEAVPIVRANHALRGVVLPAGKGTVEFRYEPASIRCGLRLCGLAVIVLCVWCGIMTRRSCRSSN